MAEGEAPYIEDNRKSKVNDQIVTALRDSPKQLGQKIKRNSSTKSPGTKSSVDVDSQCHDFETKAKSHMRITSEAPKSNPPQFVDQEEYSQQSND